MPTPHRCARRARDHRAAAVHTSECHWSDGCTVCAQRPHGHARARVRSGPASPPQERLHHPRLAHRVAQQIRRDRAPERNLLLGQHVQQIRVTRPPRPRAPAPPTRARVRVGRFIFSPYHCSQSPSAQSAALSAWQRLHAFGMLCSLVSSGSGMVKPWSRRAVALHVGRLRHVAIHARLPVVPAL